MIKMTIVLKAITLINTYQLKAVKGLSGLRLEAGEEIPISYKMSPFNNCKKIT